ncbi:MAG: diacylglycerol kinase family protein [Chitinophagaceae bacterium]
MKQAQLFHNPGAGGGEHDIEELIASIKANGFECHYSSVKEKGWEEIKEGTDFLIIAGGDGTVKKVARMVLEKEIKLPLALLPLGTANNVAVSLKLKDEKEEDIIRAWHHDKRIKYDTGKLTNAGEANFFFESFGYGIFPHLITKMRKRKLKEPETPEQNIFSTLKMLEQVISTYNAVDCRIAADGNDLSGKFFLAEIMLTRSIGPNLVLAPYSHLDDGVFDVVLLSESDKEKFAEQVSDKLNDKTDEKNFTTVKAKELTVNWAGTHVHADDELIELIPDSEVKIEIMPGALEFLIV